MAARNRICSPVDLAVDVYVSENVQQAMLFHPNNADI